MEDRGCRWRWSAAHREEQSHTVCREQHKEYKERVYGGKNGIYYSFALLTLVFPPKLLCKTHPEIAQCFWYFSGVPAKQSLTSTAEGEKTLAESEMVKKWGARVPANGVFAPDVPPIPPLPPQSATTSRGTSMPVGKGEERQRMRVCAVWMWWGRALLYGCICVFLEWPQLTCDLTDSNWFYGRWALLRCG